MKVEQYFCDIENCQKEADNKEQSSIQVIFTNEQTEGRYCSPYLSDEKIHLCKEHRETLLEGNYIFAHGAMGYNTYVLKNVRKKNSKTSKDE